MSEGWQHIEITDHGTIVVLRPISDEGREWFEEHVGAPDRALRDGGRPLGPVTTGPELRLSRRN